MKNKKILLFVLLVVLLSFLVKLFTVNYPIIGDSNLYVELTHHIVKDRSYTSPIYSNAFVQHTIVPPLFPLFSSALDYILNNPVYSIKIINILFSSLTLLITFFIIKRIGFNDELSIILVLFILFNPIYFYFTSALALTEGMAVFFLTLSFYLYLIKENNPFLNILAGIIFGLTIIIRVPMILILAPFLVYEIIKIFDNITKITKFCNISKRAGKGFVNVQSISPKILNGLAFVVLSAVPWLIWALRNIYYADVFLPSVYVDYSIMHSSIYNFVVMLAKLLFISMPIIFLFLLPLVIYGIYFVFKKDMLEWKLLVYGFVIQLLAICWFSPGSAIVRARFIILFVPLFTVMAFLFMVNNVNNTLNYTTLERPFSNSKIKNLFSNPKIRNLLLSVILIFFICSTLILNMGYIKDISDKFIMTPSIYPQESYHRSLAIRWINENAPKGPIVLQTFSDKANLVDIDQNLQYYFREDIIYYQILLPIKEFKDFSRVYLEDLITAKPNLLLNKDVFVVSDYNYQETKYRLAHLLFDFELIEMFKTDDIPFSYVYKMIIH